MIYVPGTSSLPSQVISGATQVAPVVEAKQGADQQELKGKFSDIAKNTLSSFGEEFARGMGQNVAASVKTWISS